MNINAAISEITGTERDYERDLNAMHEAEKVLTEREKQLYATWFMDYDTGDLCKTIHATAAQRAEAFLRAIGKWEE
jgi:hypothetical protein